MRRSCFRWICLIGVYSNHLLRLGLQFRTESCFKFFPPYKIQNINWYIGTLHWKDNDSMDEFINNSPENISKFFWLPSSPQNPEVKSQGMKSDMHHVSRNWLYFFLFFLCWVGGGTLWHLQKFLQCIKYIILEFTSCTGNWF
jgi:hypothetical protein